MAGSARNIAVCVALALLASLGFLAVRHADNRQPATMASTRAVPQSAVRSFLRAASTADLSVFQSFVAEEQAVAYYSKWGAQNPGELARWAGYRDAILAGRSPAPPSMSTHYGRGLVLAGVMATPPPTVSTTTSTSTVTSTASTSTAPPTTTAPPPSAAAFGISSPCDQICYQTAAQKDEEFADMAALGVGWVRIDLRWSVIESGGAGTANWAAFDDTVARARSHGLQVLAIIHSTPGWAGPSAEAPPTNIADWTNFVTNAVTHLRLSVHVFEIWNEENGSFFNGTVGQYTALLRSAYDAIKAVDPSDTVLVGGFVPGGDYSQPRNSVKYLEGIYANGGGGHFDAVANHPYTGGTADSSSTASWSNWYQMFGSSPSLHSVMAAHGDGAKRIWPDEWGYSLVQDPAPSEAEICWRIGVDVANYRALGSQVGPLFWYTDRDDGSLGYGLSGRGYPLVHRVRWSCLQAALR